MSGMAISEEDDTGTVPGTRNGQERTSAEERIAQAGKFADESKTVQVLYSHQKEFEDLKHKTTKKRSSSTMNMNG